MDGSAGFPEEAVTREVSRAQRPCGRQALLSVWIWAALAGAAAGEDAIVADRPGFGESAAVVPRWGVQVESGLSWTRLGQDQRLLDLPEVLLRVGVGGRLEVRVVASDWLRAAGDGTTSSGWSDMGIGFKWLAVAGADQVSLRGVLYVPNGSTRWSDNRVDPEGAVAWSRALSDAWSLGATLSAHRYTSVPSTFVSPSVSLGRALGHELSTYVEYGASVAKGALPVQRIDNGYTWLPTGRTQLDFSLGVGLSSIAPDFFVSVGLSHRF
jgi:Putative MetA-pathway of phenol degradation